MSKYIKKQKNGDSKPQNLSLTLKVLSVEKMENANCDMCCYKDLSSLCFKEQSHTKKQAENDLRVALNPGYYCGCGCGFDEERPEDDFQYDDYEPNPSLNCDRCGRVGVSEYHLAACEGEY